MYMPYTIYNAQYTYIHVNLLILFFRKKSFKPIPNKEFLIRSADECINMKQCPEIKMSFEPKSELESKYTYIDG